MEKKTSGEGKRRGPTPRFWFGALDLQDRALVLRPRQLHRSTPWLTGASSKTPQKTGQRRQHPAYMSAIHLCLSRSCLDLASSTVTTQRNRKNCAIIKEDGIFVAAHFFCPTGIYRLYICASVVCRRQMPACIRRGPFLVRGASLIIRDSMPGVHVAVRGIFVWYAACTAFTQP